MLLDFEDKIKYTQVVLLMLLYSKLGLDIKKDLHTLSVNKTISNTLGSVQR